MSKTTSDSSNGHGSTAQRLAVARYERQQAIFEAGAESQIPPPPRVPTLDGLGPLKPARDKLPTLDDLTGPDAPRARWKLAAAAVGALVALSEVVRQVVAFLGGVKH